MIFTTPLDIWKQQTPIWLWLTPASAIQKAIIRVELSELKLVGKTVFKGNKGVSCSIVAYGSNLQSLGTVTFHNNTCGIYSNHTRILLCGSAIFARNSWSSIRSYCSNLDFVGCFIDAPMHLIWLTIVSCLTRYYQEGCQNHLLSQWHKSQQLCARWMSRSSSYFQVFTMGFNKEF